MGLLDHAYEHHVLPWRECGQKYSYFLRGGNTSATFIGLVGLILFFWTSFTTEETPLYNLSLEDIEYGRDQCARNKQHPEVDFGLAAERLGHALTGPTTVIRNATLIDGDGGIWNEVDISIREKIFCSVRNTSDVDSYSKHHFVVNANGRYVTPGLIDMHTHAGVREEPQLWATEDVTEISAPVTPWGRAVDAIKPQDRAIQVIASGGITTSLVLTGAKNLISGEGAVIKMKRTDSIPGLLMNLTEGASNSKVQRYLKMAMGENQKRQFQGSTTGPATRIGESYWFRHAYTMASQLKQQQDRWCELAATSKRRKSLQEVYPTSLEWQTLVDVLRGDVRVNVHGYETEDVFAMFDHADEFGFKITALHHALHSDLIAKELKQRNVTIVGFSDSWGDKKELYNVSSYMLKSISDHGIPVVLTRDHPAEHGQWLAYEAQIGHHFGLPTALAIASIISEPAITLGLNNRIGFVRPGYDADLVVWDRHPLQVGATPLEVFIDGISEINASESTWRNSEKLLNNHAIPISRLDASNVSSTCQRGRKDIIIHGIRKTFIREGSLRGDELVGNNITAVIRNGRLACIGEIICKTQIEESQADGVSVMNLHNGYVLPGLTIATRQHGLTEIRQEPSTSDGISSGNNWLKPFSSVFGLKFGGIHLERAYRSGITRIITPPLAEGFFHGFSTCFRAGARNVLDDGAIIDSQNAIHFSIGHDAKQPGLPSVTSQINLLRELLIDGKHVHSAYDRASRGDIPVVVHTSNKDTISQMIILKRETGANIVIMGGSEAHHVARELAEAHMPVILAPWGCEPLFWESRDCLPGPPLTDHLGAHILLEAGVKVAVSNWDDTNNHIRNSIWEAAWIAGPQNHTLALDLVSKNIEDMLGLSPAKDFVVYEGNPFEFGASVALIFEEETVQECWPEPDEY